MSAVYDSSAIEVLTGLDPVRRRPGMYTDTSRPNHLAQEVVDNSVDEAVTGHCDRIDVTLYKDGSLSATDNGRGMPVDRHKEEGVSGVEVILTRLHAGGKFSDKNYTYSGGLHGVGVSVVNALSKRLEVKVRRDGKEHMMAFADGQKITELRALGKVDRKTPAPRCISGRTRSSSIRPKSMYRRSSACCAPRQCCARACTLPSSTRPTPRTTREWHYEDGLKDYLLSQVEGFERVPEEPFLGHAGNRRRGALGGGWLPEVASRSWRVTSTSSRRCRTAPVNGFRAGLTDAVREF